MMRRKRDCFYRLNVDGEHPEEERAISGMVLIVMERLIRALIMESWCAFFVNIRFFKEGVYYVVLFF